MSNKEEKLAVAGLALFIAVSGTALLTTGSFLPHWAAASNATVQGNVSFSLWTRRECFGVICVTVSVPVQWTNEDCWYDRDAGRERCETTTGTKQKIETKCREANFCKTTWFAGAVFANNTWFPVTDMDNTPSMLIVAKAFETPAIFFSLVCIVLYVIKIVLLVKQPSVKRLHLKAAYLTFGAIAGVVSVVGVILFCSMLEGDVYTRQWAPFVNLTGGILFILFGFGGYLMWRDRTADGDFEDDTSLCEQHDVNEIHASKLALRQVSQTSSKDAEASSSV